MEDVSRSVLSQYLPECICNNMDAFIRTVMTLPAHPHLSQHVVPFLESNKWITSPSILSHLHTVLYIAFGYHLLFLVSMWFIFPPIAGYRLSWNTKDANRNKRELVIQSSLRLVSWIQSLIVLYLSFEAILYNKSVHPQSNSYDRIFRSDPYNVQVCVFAIGYFLWDIYISLVYSTMPFVLHGVVSTVVYTIGLKPYINYYAGIFLMFELSNPFLNFRWLGIKYMPQLTNDPTSRTLAAKICNVIQLVNNIILIVVFFAARICWGFYQFFRLCKDFYAVRNDPHFLPLDTSIIVVGNLSLDVLNLIWMSSMLAVAARIIKKGGKVQDK
ncbi:hypothetical protein C6P41_003261 [Kluyveromyces marxianus]|nr:hypothetical protein C6P43_003083 [Kluyveromyces marxianus]KAG0683237.1 hypothetical protein C6P41_003261 [Kluyveromyces marxianus]